MSHLLPLWLLMGSKHKQACQLPHDRDKEVLAHSADNGAVSAKDQGRIKLLAQLLSGQGGSQTQGGKGLVIPRVHQLCFGVRDSPLSHVVQPSPTGPWVGMGDRKEGRALAQHSRLFPLCLLITSMH